MKTQWETYQALELIPADIPYPKLSLLARLTAPWRRHFADTFVRELCLRHQVLFLKRCFDRADLALLPVPQREKEPSMAHPLTQQQQLMAQVWISRGSLPWWTWYDS